MASWPSHEEAAAVPGVRGVHRVRGQRKRHHQGREQGLAGPNSQDGKPVTEPCKNSFLVYTWIMYLFQKVQYTLRCLEPVLCEIYHTQFLNHLDMYLSFIDLFTKEIQSE